MILFYAVKESISLLIYLTQPSPQPHNGVPKEVIKSLENLGSPTCEGVLPETTEETPAWSASVTRVGVRVSPGHLSWSFHPWLEAVLKQQRCKQPERRSCFLLQNNAEAPDWSQLGCCKGKVPCSRCMHTAYHRDSVCMLVEERIRSSIRLFNLFCPWSNNKQKHPTHLPCRLLLF